MGEPYGRASGMHRIVAIAFIPNPDNLPEVNHIDGDKANNRVDNLEWVSKKENQYHASHVLNKRAGSDCHMSKLTDEIVIEIYNLCKNKDLTYVEIAEMYDVHPDTPCRIAKGETWEYLNLKPMRRKDKPVICINIETGEEKRYPSARFAQEDGFTNGGVSRCCTGKQSVHRGHIFKYA